MIPYLKQKVVQGLLTNQEAESIENAGRIARIIKGQLDVIKKEYEKEEISGNSEEL